VIKPKNEQMKNEKKLILDLIDQVQAVVDANPPTTPFNPVPSRTVLHYDVVKVNAALPTGCQMVNGYGHLTLTLPNGTIGKTTPEGLSVIKKAASANFDSAKFGERAMKKGGGKCPRFAYATLHPAHVANGDNGCYDSINVNYQVQQVHDNLRMAQASGNAALIAAMQKQGEQLRDQVGAASFRAAVLELAEAGVVKLDPKKVIEPTPLAMAA